MRIEQLTWQEYAEVIAHRIVVLPIGAIDAHGPHLPLSTDTIISSYLAKALERHLDVLVLPAIPYGRRTDARAGGGQFPGVTNLRASTLMSLVLDVLRASHCHGARRFVLLDSHMANLQTVHEAAELFVEDAPDARLMVVSWWDVVSEESRNDIARETGVGRHEDHHAAMVETSLTMYAAPGAVRTDLLRDDIPPRRSRYMVIPAPDDLRTTSGVVYRASRASPEIGERLMKEIVSNLVDAVKLELA